MTDDHIPLNTTSEFFNVFIPRIYIHSEIMKDSTSFTFENHTFGDISFEENVFKR